MGDQGGASKKTLSDLTREELIEKCKNYLQIAQKAKTAKDELSKEVASRAEKESALSEIVEKLTQEKLNFVAEKDDLKKKLILSEKKIEKLSEKLTSSEKKLDDFSRDVEQKNEICKNLKRKISELESENEATNRQLKRSDDENDSLLNQIDGLEKELDKVQSALKDSKQRCDELMTSESKNQELKAKIICLEQNVSDVKKERGCLERELVLVRDTDSVNQQQLSKLVEEKEVEIAELKTQIAAISEEKLEGKESEMAKVKEQLVSALAQNSDLKNGLEQANGKLNASESVLSLFRNEVDDLKSEISSRENERSKNDESLSSSLAQVEALKNELELVKSEKAELEKMQVIQVKELKAANEKELSELHVRLSEGMKNFEQSDAANIEKIKELTEKIESLQKEVTTAGENHALLVKEISEEKEKLECQEAEIEDLQNQKKNLEEDLAQREVKIEDFVKELEKLSAHACQADTELDNTVAELTRSVEKKQEVVQLVQKLTDVERLAEERLAEVKELKKKLEHVDELKGDLESVTAKFEEEKSMLEKEVESLKSANCSVDERMRDFQTEKVEFVKKIDDYDKKMKNYEEVVIKLEEEKANLYAQLAEKDEEMVNLVSAKEELVQKQKVQIQNMETNQSEAFRALRHETEVIMAELESFADLKQAHVLVQQKLAESTTRANNLEENVQRLEMEKSEISDKQKGEIINRIKHLKDFTLSVSTELSSMKDFAASQTSETLKFLSDFEASFSDLKNAVDKDIGLIRQQNSDLLEDLNKINLEMRIRGEKISMLTSKNDEKDNMLSHLQQKVADLKTANSEIKSQMDAQLASLHDQLAIRESEMEKLKENMKSEAEETIVELRQSLSEKEKEIKRLNQQIQDLSDSSATNRSLNKSVSSHLDESQSEVMSTSTISKVEEANRMADIEATFEDRYTKLKLVAIKLKIKTKDQETKIAELEQRQKESAKLSQVVANFNSLQSEYDALQDKCDSQGNQIKVLHKDLEMSVQDCTRTKEKLATTESDLNDKNARLGSVTSELSECQTKMKNLEEARTSQDKAITKISSENKELNEKLAQLTLKLDQLTNMNKKQDMLDMELEEAESRIQQLTQLYEDVRGTLESKEIDLKLELEARINREMQIKELEDTLAKETDRAQDLKEKLTHSRQTISDLESDLSKSDSKLDQIQRDLDSKRGDVEKLTLQLAEISGNAMNSAKSLTTRNESLQKMVSLLETEVDRRKQRTDELEARLISVEKEFENYKVRAQSVLRQAKDKDSHLNEKSQEVSNLERVVNSLNEKINDISTQHAALNLEHRLLQEEYDRLMERHSVLLQEMAAKEKGAREKIDHLNKTISETELSRQNAITHWQQEAENIRQNYRSEIESLTNQHTAEVSRLQQNIDKLDNQIIRLQMLARKSPQSQNQRNPSSSPHLTDLELSLLEREAAEGSESADNSYQRGVSLSPINQLKFKSNDEHGIGQHHQPLLPLDQLLLQKEDDGDSHTLSRQISEVSGTIDNGWSENAMLLEKRANTAEKQVKHMASLLSESEAENARHIQLAQVLKEEIRSYRRSEERSKHIENLEYVKNVILKFLTMPESVERSRLIPVLTTILRLSQEEVEKLQSSVTADTDQAAVPETGWSSYLGLWNP